MSEAALRAPRSAREFAACALRIGIGGVLEAALPLVQLREPDVPAEEFRVLLERELQGAIASSCWPAPSCAAARSIAAFGISRAARRRLAAG